MAARPGRNAYGGCTSSAPGAAVAPSPWPGASALSPPPPWRPASGDGLPSSTLRGVGADDAREFDQARNQDLADDVLAHARQALEARHADVQRMPGLGGRHPDRELRLEIRRIVEAADLHRHAAR